MSDSQQDRERGATSGESLDEGPPETSIDSLNRALTERSQSPTDSLSSGSMDQPNVFSQEAAGNTAMTHYTKPALQKHTLVGVTENPHKRLCKERQVSDVSDQQEIIQVLPPPGEITFLSVTSHSVTLKWSPPEGLEGPHKFRVTWSGGGQHKSLTVTDVFQIEIDKLRPGEKYVFRVTTEGDHGNSGRCVFASTYTVVPPPTDIKINQSGATSLVLSWSKAPGLEEIPHFFLITCRSPGIETLAIPEDDCLRELSDLKADTEYTISVSTVLRNGQQTEPIFTTIYTIIPSPKELTVESIEISSASLSWSPPDGMEQTQHQYQVSYQCSGEEELIRTTSSLNISLSGLQPASDYSVSVCTLLDNGGKSQPVSIIFITRVPAPSTMTIEKIQSSSLDVHWTKPPGMENIPHHFLISYRSPASEPQREKSTDCSRTLSDLQPATEYTISVSTVTEDGEQSQPVTAIFSTILQGTSADVATSDKEIGVAPGERDHEGGSPEIPMDTDPNRPEYILCDICSERKAVKTCLTCTMSYCETHIRTHYTKLALQKHTLVDVTEDSHQILLIPGPKDLKVDSVQISSASLSWSPPDGMDQTQHQYQVSYRCSGEELIRTTSSLNISRSGLQPATDYCVSVCTVVDNGMKSQPVSSTFKTRVQAPSDLRIDQVCSSSLTLHWTKLPGMENIPHHFLISYKSPGSEPQREKSTDCSTTLSDLQPGTEYTISVSMVTEDGEQSEPVTASSCTRLCLNQLLSQIGLAEYYENKLTLSTVLEINTFTMSDEPIKTMQLLSSAFLKKLIMSNVNARSMKCFTTGNRNINPLDLITALFLCSDGFLQQEMVLKMSMCQFAVPLLLPNCETKQSTLMLWAMRDIVKKFRTSQTATKSFTEERVVLSDMPMVSFVRLGESHLPKSQTLNKLLSNPQQYHDTFIHNNMEGGNVQREISDGLVEISWYLPSGNSKTDVFKKPVAMANLRGDIRAFEREFLFLCQTSAAVYIFCDEIETSLSFLKGKNTKAGIFLVVNSHTYFKTDGSFKHKNVIVKGNLNDAEFVCSLQSTIIKKIDNLPKKLLSIESMATMARDCGILVDEDCSECQEGKRMADEITSTITNTLNFKEEQLPLHGKLWKEISQMEKENCRLRKLGDEAIEPYKSSLRKKTNELRKEQQGFDIPIAMEKVLQGMSTSEMKRSYFLKWMRINLDNLSRKSLTDLRARYKELCQNSPVKKHEIVEIDKQMSDCSLGLEHFLRELGQLYESACLLPKNNPKRKQMEHLPRLCAQMMLGGFPIELVDGDASNIPVKWISAVLTELHKLVGSNSKIKVVTVLGVQSSGKSTLLNTMFGVQFAVSSGRCTRGAFMLLLGVGNDLKDELKCDFIMVIDTEGLKSPELAQLEDSYEHDNELATLVIGLSDVTIINIAMENYTEMKDILQIVVHAFIRMKEVGKRPVCHFVHQNVSDMSAYDNNMRDRKTLLEQLNEMTVAAAKMENNQSITMFTDVIQYNPDKNSCYIPGLWHGNPPMAPVNAGYSDAVYTFKKTLIDNLKESQGSNDLTKLQKWIKCLWDAVKFEKFIFSFQNTLVAESYAKLCNTFNGWAWSFQKDMRNWILAAETEIENIDMTNQTCNTHQELTMKKQALLMETLDKLTMGEQTIQDNLKKYFDNEDEHTRLVEKYRQGFVSSINTLRMETETNVRVTLQSAVEIREGKAQLENIKSSQASIMENKVLELLKNCREVQSQSSEQDLEKAFGTMWSQTLSEINFSALSRRNVATDAHIELRENLSTKQGAINKMLTKVTLADCGKKSFEVKSTWWDKLKHLDLYHKQKVKEFCHEVIEECEELVSETVKSKRDYSEAHIRDVIKRIDSKVLKLKEDRNIQISDECQANLKFHICGRAAREFQRMHDSYIEDNNPRKCLSLLKDKYYSDFIDLFNDRDQSQKKAEEFTKKCLQPAVLVYVTKRIGPDIVDEMLMGEGSEGYSTRMAFQFNILEQLLHDNAYDAYKQYMNSYERFVKEWLFGKITDKLLQENTLNQLEIKHLSQIIKVINKSILQDKSTSTVNNIKTLIDNISNDLKKDLEIPKDALNSVKRLNKSANTEGFVQILTEFVKEMEKSLAAEYEKGGDIPERLRSLPFKPQDQMFKDLFGCGKQCPFCGAPCEAGGTDHTKHFASSHRPEGLHRMQWHETRVLVTDICSSAVISGSAFKNAQTEGKFHPFKDYQKYYPDWEIIGDASLKASDYWKYVMATFNERIAADNNALPADIPEDWKTLTPDDAMKSLNYTFKRT